MNRRGSAIPEVHETVVHMLAEAAALAGEHTALVCGERRLTYAEYVRCVGGFAHELMRAGAGAGGGRVALICGNSMEIAVAMFAAHAAGAQAVPINPIYTARELRHILSDSEPAVVVYDADVAPTVEPVLDELGIGQRIMVGGNGRLLDAWRDDEGAALPARLPAADDLATLQYTGGTTGAPKGVDISHRQMSTNISQREAVLPTRAGDEAVLCMMPLFHVFAVSMCLHLTAYCRGTLHILERYRPDAVLGAIPRERITRLPAGPTVFIGLMGFDGFAETDFSSLRAAYSGSAPLPEDALRRWQASTGCPIYEGYGQTEAGPILTYVGEGDEIVPGCVGLPVPGTEVEIVDVETGTIVLGAGERGEIRARGPQIMTGYRNRADETAEALRGGWLHTGDIGEIDEAGLLYIRDRKKDMAIVGGYNVYPREIDEVLHGHAAVLEAAAVGVPDDYRGEVIKAYVVLAAGAAAGADELLAHCRANLARYKLPVTIDIVDSLPKTAVGKIDKRALKEA